MPNEIIEEVINKLRYIDKEWFYSFFEMLENANVSQETICKALALASHKENQYAGAMGQDNWFAKSPKAKKCMNNFLLIAQS